MVRGRKPTPNIIKINRGNPGKRPLNENEPPVKEVTRIPTLPVSLKGNKIGAKQWRLLARKLIDMNVLGDVDLMALEQLRNDPDVELRELPQEVFDVLRGHAQDAIDELSARDEWSRRLQKSQFDFMEKSSANQKISELAYLNMRVKAQ